MRVKFLLAPVFVILTTVFLPFVNSATAQTNNDIQTYMDVMTGRRTYKSLTPTEKRTFLYLRSLSQTKSNGTPECNDALNNAKNNAQSIIYEAQRLIKCVSSGDYKDDCSSPFRSLKSDYSDYESSVSEVNSECD